MSCSLGVMAVEIDLTHLKQFFSHVLCSVFQSSTKAKVVIHNLFFCV